MKVWYYRKDGRREVRILKREHRCTKRCLSVEWMFGLPFPWCRIYSLYLKGD